jgi:hypothetical protein
MEEAKLRAEALAIYLNDHLAGSVAAIELVEQAIRVQEGTPLARFLHGLGEDIKADQDTLRDLLSRLGASESRLKQAGAWLTEKASRLKLGGAEEGTALARLETLETLSLGILGKLALWRVLRAIAPRHHELAGFDFVRLEQRAAEQHDEVEARRLEAARDAL